MGLYERVRPLLHNRGLIFEIRSKIALFMASEICPFFDCLRFGFCLVVDDVDVSATLYVATTFLYGCRQYAVDQR